MNQEGGGEDVTAPGVGNGSVNRRWRHFGPGVMLECRAPREPRWTIAAPTPLSARKPTASFMVSLPLKKGFRARFHEHN